MSGGYNNEAEYPHSWVGGGYKNRARGGYSSIAGGKEVTLLTEFGVSP